MFAGLSTSIRKYKYSSIFYNAEFEKILSKIITCHALIIKNNVRLANNENKIRDYILSNYLKNPRFKKQYGITDYLFDKELVENIGRIDIRIMPLNPFISDDAYYIIECKRLNGINQSGKTGLNGKYISEGIYRFVFEKYSTHFKVNGMIGFIVESIDIDKNVISISKLLKTSFKGAKTIQDLKRLSIVSTFNYSYYSKHKIQSKTFLIYHLMFDLSKNIQ